MRQGPFPPAKLCCLRHHRYYGPIRRPLRLRCDFPCERLYAPPPPGPQIRGRIGPPQFPCPPSGHPDPPTPEGSWAPASPGSSAPSVAFAQTKGARHPLVPVRGQPHEAAGFASRYGLVSRWSLEGLVTLRFDAGRFPPTPAACYRTLLAAIRARLSPAGEHELVSGIVLFHNLLSLLVTPTSLGALGFLLGFARP
jgi:hypothetical protein